MADRYIIEIPDAFVSHFNENRFKDTFCRLAVDAHLLAGNYELETVEMLVKSFENAIKISS